MSVKKIFVILITVVVCVIIGAFIINILMPNAVASLINAAEDQIYNATGLSFDFNGDGTGGSSKYEYDASKTGNGDDALQGGNVDGFK